jgi:hypothetical protein
MRHGESTRVIAIKSKNYAGIFSGLNILQQYCLSFLPLQASPAGAKRTKTIEANEFLVRDRAGKIVARLGHDDFGDTCLTLTAQQSVSVANLCVQDNEGSSLDLHNLKSDSRATLTGFQRV